MSEYRYEYEGRRIPTPIRLGDWLLQDEFYTPSESYEGYEPVTKEEVQSIADGVFYLSITKARIASHIIYGYDFSRRQNK